MYFVVYSFETKQYFVIPVNWVQDLRWTNHINLSLNRCQYYRCYWTLDPAAWINNVPRNDFRPNFAVPIRNEFPSQENCYICRLAHYNGKLTICIL